MHNKSQWITNGASERTLNINHIEKNTRLLGKGPRRPCSHDRCPRTDQKISPRHPSHPLFGNAGPPGAAGAGFENPMKT